MCVYVCVYECIQNVYMHKQTNIHVHIHIRIHTHLCNLKALRMSYDECKRKKYVKDLRTKEKVRMKTNKRRRVLHLSVILNSAPYQDAPPASNKEKGTNS